MQKWNANNELLVVCTQKGEARESEIKITPRQTSSSTTFAYSGLVSSPFFSSSRTTVFPQAECRNERIENGIGFRVYSYKDCRSFRKLLYWLENVVDSLWNGRIHKRKSLGWKRKMPKTASVKTNSKSRLIEGSTWISGSSIIRPSWKRRIVMRN